VLVNFLIVAVIPWLMKKVMMLCDFQSYGLPFKWYVTLIHGDHISNDSTQFMWWCNIDNTFGN